MTTPSTEPTPPPRRSADWTERLALAALGAVLLAGVTQGNFVDPDLWHEMSLVRESLAVGSLMTTDVFAYTPTIAPIVHHEWGTGLVLFAVVSAAGALGLLLLKYGLTAAVAFATVKVARKRGTPWAVLCPLAPLAVFISWNGFTTVRAQMFTMLFTALCLWAMERDREGRRDWMLPWVVIQILWVNLHGGVVVGMLLMGLYTLEQALRRQPIRHLIAFGPVLLATLLVSPYGFDYVPYLWNALRMPRPDITEWRPVWAASPPIMMMFGISALTALYAVGRVGIKRATGLSLLLFTAYAAARHQRHLSIYAVVWLALVPAWMTSTPLGQAFIDLFARRPRTMRWAWGGIGALCLVGALANRPWELRMPANPGEHKQLTYPVGAVEYLQTHDYHGNLMVPFTEGAFVAWKLHPEVKISIDGRYEVAYAPGVFESYREVYTVGPRWKDVLNGNGTDAVLAPTGKLATTLDEADDWNRIYSDDAYAVFVRPGSTMPIVDRRGEHLVASFP